MKTDALQQAREYEALYGERISGEERPHFHVTPWIGWMNDPNGFSLYRGEYHLFYQYHPYSTAWGPMHWGHVKTKDFIRWERLPAIMAPGERYDEFGCFSGSAVEMQDGTHAVMYTGVRLIPTEDGTLEERQVQCMAYGDGVDYEKYAGNPVLTAADVPEGGSEIDFRDPRLWYDGEEQRYYAVVGNRCADGSGSILLFGSEDTRKWERLAVLDGSHNQFGGMWECPDFFRLDGTDVLITSPQEMKGQGPEFHNGNITIYLTGNYDKDSHSFQRSGVYVMDQGLDFYAPQTVLTPDGRRVMIAWMQSWESSRCVPRGFRWFGMMTVPRELHVKDGRLIQNPVRELEAYRCDPVVFRDLEIFGETVLSGVSGRCLDLTVDVRPCEEQPYQSMTIRVAENKEYRTCITFDPVRSLLLFDRTASGFPYDVVNTREIPVRDRKGEIRLRILLDRYSVEIFVNDGEQAVSSALYTPQSAERITFEAEGSAVVDVVKYDLNIT